MFRLGRVRARLKIQLFKLLSWLGGAKVTASLALRDMVVDSFLDSSVGRFHGLERREKLALLRQFQANVQRIPTEVDWLYHIILATEILSVPPSVRGAVIECGCYKGGGTANLSLVCQLANRKLIVCDSFEGLPEDKKGTVHHYPHLKVFGYYRKGMYAGRLEEVKQNVEDWGQISVCEFLPGFFSNSLKKLSEPIVLAFLDVDLGSSMRDCIKYIWPLLVDGGKVFTDDSCDMEVVRTWFDDAWWNSNLGQRAPGYIGSGCGLPLSPDYTALGYTCKVSKPEQAYQRISWLWYPKDSPDNPPIRPGSST